MPWIGAQKPSWIAWYIDAVVHDGDVDHLVALLRLQLGQRVGRVAGDVVDLDVVLLLEVREHLLAQMLVPDAAIGRDGQLLLRQRRQRAGQQGHACECAPARQTDHEPLPFEYSLAVMVSMRCVGVKFDFAGGFITEYYDRACAA